MKDALEMVRLAFLLASSIKTALQALRGCFVLCYSHDCLLPSLNKKVECVFEQVGVLVRRKGQVGFGLSVVCRRGDVLCDFGTAKEFSHSQFL